MFPKGLMLLSVFLWGFLAICLSKGFVHFKHCIDSVLLLIRLVLFVYFRILSLEMKPAWQPDLHRLSSRVCFHLSSACL